MELNAFALTSPFRAAARRVRVRLAVRRVLTGAAIGLTTGAALAFTLYLAHRFSIAHPLWSAYGRWFRPALAGAGVVGAIAGYLVARSKRLGDEAVALFLDARLDTQEAITTALDGAGRDADDPVLAVVIDRANAALATATSADLRLPVARPMHALVPVMAGALAVASLLPVAGPVVPLPPPGSELVRVADVEGIDQAIRLAALDARDEAQRERLKKLAEEAERIREKAKNGAAERELKADVAKLADKIAAERMSLGDGAERKGLEDAMNELGKNRDLQKAAQALGDHDLVAFDEEMAKLANSAEAEDRERAKKALEDAEKAARDAGAKSVADAIAEERKLLEKGEAKSNELRDLADALGDAGGDAAKDAKRDLDAGDPKAQKALADALEKALSNMTPEEKKKLAEKLKELAAKQGNDPGGATPQLSKEDLENLAKQLEDPNAAKQLEEQLRDLANAPPESSAEAQRQQALDAAAAGLGAPKPGSQPGGGGGNGPSGHGSEPGGAGGDKSPPGPTNKGPAKPTDKVDAGDLRSKANAKRNGGAPMPGVSVGRASSRSGETANVQGTGALGTVAPDEIGGVAASDVPEEYRSQVGKYFQP